MIVSFSLRLYIVSKLASYINHWSPQSIVHAVNQTSYSFAFALESPCKILLLQLTSVCVLTCWCTYHPVFFTIFLFHFLSRCLLSALKRLLLPNSPFLLFFLGAFFRQKIKYRQRLSIWRCCICVSVNYCDTFLYIFWRARVCWPLLCLFHPFLFFERRCAACMQ